jgi:glycosyltransferase involved in cell wall biosynthesis
LGLQNDVVFTGYLSGDQLLQHLSAFDIGIIPDPMNPYNDKISMNKVFEYSALGIPSVGYPLTETRRLLQDGGVFSKTTDVEGLAEACLTLMQDDEKREQIGRAAKRISDSSFNWDREALKYLGAYDRLKPAASVEAREADETPASSPP